MMALPETVAVTVEEGGDWIDFKVNDPLRRGHLGVRYHFVHSIKFSDGSIWDATNGWRGPLMRKVGGPIDATGWAEAAFDPTPVYDWGIFGQRLWVADEHQLERGYP